MHIYVSIGNSDDKLTQRQWSNFCDEVDRLVQSYSMFVHGRWASIPTDPWQNACWCIELSDDDTYRVEALKEELRQAATDFDQESIAWAVAETEFLKP